MSALWGLWCSVNSAWCADLPAGGETGSLCSAVSPCARSLFSILATKLNLGRSRKKLLFGNTRFKAQRAEELASLLFTKWCLLGPPIYWACRGFWETVHICLGTCGANYCCKHLPAFAGMRRHLTTFFFFWHTDWNLKNCMLCIWRKIL